MFLVISKDNCIYCDKAIKLLEEKEEEYVVVDKEEISPFLIQMMKHKFNHKTYPFIFEFIGGYDVLHNKLSNIN